jgi:hypothetical protein
VSRDVFLAAAVILIILLALAVMAWIGASIAEPYLNGLKESQ